MGTMKTDDILRGVERLIEGLKELERGLVGLASVMPEKHEGEICRECAEWREAAESRDATLREVNRILEVPEGESMVEWATALMKSRKRFLAEGRKVAAGACWCYVESEKGLWTVGHYGQNNRFFPESDHFSQESAAARVNYLNGGGVE